MVQDVMHRLSEYELRVFREIEVWNEPQYGVLSRAVEYVSATPAFRWISQHVPPVPQRIVRPVVRSIQGFLELLKDGSYWTYSEQAILRAARRENLDVERIEDLADKDLNALDRVARSFFAENKIMSALEGAGTGLGGMILIAADIPALFTVALRAIQQVGASYGFDMKDPNMTPIIMNILGFASGAEEATKIATLTDMHIAARMYAQRWSYKKVAERTIIGGAANALKQAAKRMPQEIAKSITKKKLAQMLPLVGAAVGAGFNYWFISNTSRTAYMLFREMYLARKYPNLWEEPKLSPA